MTGSEHGDRVAKSTLGDILPNLIFFGIGLGVLLFLGSKWPIVGKIGFWGYAVFTVVDIVRVVVMWVTGVLLVFAPERVMKPIRWRRLRDRQSRCW